MARHPIRIVVSDDLQRSRLTVFFRLLLAIPHLIWFSVWSVGTLVVGVINWVATLISGQSPAGLHDFLARYVRYAVHLHAYLSLTANPFPPFTGRPGRYPIDLEVDPPQRQSRWKTVFRILLALPALLIASAFTRAGAAYASSDDRAFTVAGLSGVLPTIAFLAWFACLAHGRMPRGFRDAIVYGLRYVAQAWAYVLLVTDRYPNSDPGPAPQRTTPTHPIDIRLEDEGRRSRLTVFFRFLLVLPHLVWLALWSIAVVFCMIAGWFVALFGGRLPERLHRFFTAYVRYSLHVYAFLSLVGNPFPGFTGKAGSYPVDLEAPERERQSRWVTGFRLVLVFPAVIVAGALGGLLVLAAVLGWFAALVTARMPRGLQRMGAYVLRYDAQVHGYFLLLTDRYPYSGPWINLPEAEPKPELLVWS